MRLEDLKIRYRQASDTSLAVPKGNVVATRPDGGAVLKAGRVSPWSSAPAGPGSRSPTWPGRQAEAAEHPEPAASLKARPERVFDEHPWQPGSRHRAGHRDGRALGVDGGPTHQQGPDLVEVPDVVGLP